ncbi:SRPBCC domain-containing protein [Paenibacillus sp. LMG 31460]|uniref:SRPBCC domain-containing protein n=1 Tax=Paenibacillus germinis TaxID=2654979 RepID=A0ABX1YYB7_9BACL|nr:SRPBCC domain-containing protein [Paenibacillus germinis]NOU84743.1 SRPBCC domain-containing protein [Paenibacillus germinis]
MNTNKPVGLTASVGFQIGVRRTLPFFQEEAWELLTSTRGRKLWLGDLATFELVKGHKFVTQEGTTGEFRVVKPLEQLRLTWQPAGFPNTSTLQIRLMPAASPGKITISFHQEKLDSAEQREEMKVHWEEVLSRLLALSEDESIR